MKNLFLLTALALGVSTHAQFNIHVVTTPDFAGKTLYIYGYNGSKDILISKVDRSGNSWDYKVTKPYSGMMRAFFPERNNSFSFISENKDVNIKFSPKNNKISDIDYLDQPNKLMNDVQDFQRKKEQILPALYQINEYYKADSPFGTALIKEIDNLSRPAVTIDAGKNPFVSYYFTNYNKYLVEGTNTPRPSKEDFINFFSKSDEKLETSSLLRPMLLSYINIGDRANAEANVDDLLKAVNVETPRGQTILSELIDIFDASGLLTLKDKYLSLAGNLKCTITDRLASTIQANKNIALNAKFPNYKFNNATNTSAKSIYDIKARQKIIVFWSSTCSHCEAELPQLLSRYAAIKAQGTEIIGLSLDSNKSEYEEKVKSLPWINDTELKGWYSTFADTYNVHATPTYFILDSQDKIIAKPDHVEDVLEFLKMK